MVTPERDGRAIFKILKVVVNDGVGARVGVLSFPKRRPLETPNFLGLTARGAVPHVTPDNVTKRTEIGGVYMALEDSPAILELKSDELEPLHAFTATPPQMFTVLAARRHPAVASPIGNAKDSISVFTSTGFRNLTTETYREAVDSLKPDAVIPLADLSYVQTPTVSYSKKWTFVSNSKRQHRMIDRTEEWLAEFLQLGESEGEAGDRPSAVFAPVLPIPYPTQWEYLHTMEKEHSAKLSGLAVYDVDVLPDLIHHRPLMSLPRLSLNSTVSPQDILRQIQLGIDLFAVEFLNTISDAGIALSFSFPAPQNTDGEIKPLGINMWSQDHEVSVTPLADGCQCHACTKHHRAYLHHLLEAKEMLGWTLLQIHNYHIMNKFFVGVRDSLKEGEDKFQRDCDNFSRAYDSELPVGTGVRPRARGYNFKSQGGDDKMNAPAWAKYEGESDPALAGKQAGLVVTGAAAEGNETPLVPDANAMKLDQEGFAEITKLEQSAM
ncbi:tRNA-guanine transglycosylase [Xylariaceae sp. FL1019]|nr:tRNA-guanine transglycosylase [Xylariaceae sp. FL1019]